MIKGIEIKTIVVVESVDYVVDIFSDFDLNFFAPVQQLFLASEVLTESEEVYTETKFTFRHTLANSVATNAIMTILIPA